MMAPPSGPARRTGRRMASSALLPVLSLLLSACQGAPREEAQSPAAQTVAMSPAEHGRHLVAISGCNDCHTPFRLGPNGPEPDMTRMLSGHPEALVMPPPPAPEGPWIWFGAGTNTAFAGPWGVNFASNLTPDTTTGLGAWTEEIFVETLRTGRHMGSGRPLLPPMPWPGIAQMTDEELHAVYAYLRSIPPIENQVPLPLPPAALPGGNGESR